MKLNMSILYDELRAYTRSASLQEWQNFPLTGCRLFPQNASQLSPRHAYICTSQDLLRVMSAQKAIPLNFICIGELNPQDVNWQIIFLKGNVHAEDIFEILQDTFDDYNEWDDELSMAVTIRDNYQAILDIGARKLWNPIALADLSMCDLACSGQFTSSASTWGSLDSGFAMLERSSDQDLATTSQLLRVNRTPFYVPTSLRDAQYVMAPIYSGKVLYGILKTNDMNQPVTQGQLAIIYHIQQWIQRAVTLTPIPIPLTSDNLMFADKLIDGGYVEPASVYQALKGRGWAEDDDYLLLACRLASGANIGDHRSGNFVMRLKRIISDSIVFIYEPYIIILAHGISELSQEDTERLKSLLKQTRLIAGMSMPFTGFMSLRNAFIQASIATEITGNNKTKEQEDTTMICNIRECYQDFVLRIMEEARGLGCICHSRLLRYAQNGGEKELGHIRCLREYLLHGCNASATAAALFIHRNTLHSYLEHIRKGTGIDAAQIHSKDILYLYLSCLSTEYILKRKG